MRRPERIPIFLKLINNHLDDVITDCYKLNFDENDLIEITEMFYSNFNKIERYWIDNSDLRFSQVLVANRIIPNIPGFWYYMEEDDVLERLKINPREFLLWGQFFDKDMNRLSKPIYRTIGELETDHIKAILDGNWCNAPNYIECFKDELIRRSII